MTYGRSAVRYWHHLRNRLNVDLKKNGPIKWSQACTEAFLQIKNIHFSGDHPRLSGFITIDTDASDMQLMAVIMQKFKTLASYSQK